MRSRVAIFEGYSSPFRGRPSSLGRPYGRSLSGPIFQNPRMAGSLGRRGYYVPPEYPYGPAEYGKRRPKAVRKGYRVKRMKDTPAMKRAMNRFKKAAKACARRRKGSFQACMRRKLKK